MAQVRRASAAIPCRTVKFTRSIKAVFNLPEKPNPCKAAVSASSVPRRMTWRDPNQLAPPVAFLHLTIDQARCHLPLTHVPASTISYEPVSKMGREGIEIQI